MHQLLPHSQLLSTCDGTLGQQQALKPYVHDHSISLDGSSTAGGGLLHSGCRALGLLGLAGGLRQIQPPSSHPPAPPCEVHDALLLHIQKPGWSSFAVAANTSATK